MVYFLFYEKDQDYHLWMESVKKCYKKIIAHTLYILSHGNSLLPYFRTGMSGKPTQATTTNRTVIFSNRFDTNTTLSF